MKAEELMIGDWVWYDNQPHQIRQLGIFGENRDGDDYPAVCVGKPNGVGLILERNEIEPIPLTQEILEKNGFVPKFSDGCLTEYLIYKDIVDGLHEMYIKIVYFNTEEKEHKLECFDCKTGGCQIWIKYVHQLQQALRLCGIEKTIEL